VELLSYALKDLLAGNGWIQEFDLRQRCHKFRPYGSNDHLSRQELKDKERDGRRRLIQIVSA
jgi:hypothetical protein